MLKVRKTNFFDFFTKGNFVIPNYQRGYVWQENEWKNFYDDVKSIVEEKFKITHFMGNILIKKNQDGIYEIIDGQQRLITILLFVKAFETVYNEIKPSLRKKYISKINEYKLDVNDSDNIFSSILTYQSYTERTTTNKSSEYIQKAYFELVKYIKNNGTPIFKKTIPTDESLYRLLKRLIFIEINIDIDHNPYLIFETLNARGIELNIADLVKNHLIEHSENKTFISNEWNRITNGFNGSEFESIFKFFYNSREDKKKLLKQITKTIRGDLAVNDFLQKLSSYTDKYKKFSNIHQTYAVQEVQTYISYLNHLDNEFFKILAIPASIKFVDSEFLKLLKLCEVFVFRYLIITKKDERIIENNFFNVAIKINNDKITTANEVYNLLYKELFIDDEEFENAFSYVKFIYAKRTPHKYHNKTKLVKYILYRIENYLRGDLQLSLIATGTNDISIEHIENESSTSLSDEHKYRLGNYALMKESDNNAIGQNASTFTDKRNSIYYQNSQYLTLIGGNRNGKTLPSASSYILMDEANIKNRQRQLAKIAVDLWSLDGRQFVIGTN